MGESYLKTPPAGGTGGDCWAGRALLSDFPLQWGSGVYSCRKQGFLRDLKKHFINKCSCFLNCYCLFFSCSPEAEPASENGISFLPEGNSQRLQFLEGENLVMGGQGESHCAPVAAERFGLRPSLLGALGPRVGAAGLGRPAAPNSPRILTWS